MICFNFSKSWLLRRRRIFSFLHTLGSRILHLLIVLSLLTQSSAGIFLLPAQTAALLPTEVIESERLNTVNFDRLSEATSYQAPSFTHAEPRIGERPGLEKQYEDQSGASADGDFIIAADSTFSVSCENNAPANGPYHLGGGWVLEAVGSGSSGLFIPFSASVRRHGAANPSRWRLVGRALHLNRDGEWVPHDWIGYIGVRPLKPDGSVWWENDGFNLIGSGTYHITLERTLNRYTAIHEIGGVHINVTTKLGYEATRVYIDEFSVRNLCGDIIFGPPDRTNRSNGDPKNDNGDPRECQIAACGNTQGHVGDPINTRTGGVDYSIVDLSFPTAAGPLLFQRTYASQATDLYATSLGYGWTHNHDTRLVFPTDPDGEPGVVWFKAHSPNQYFFKDNGNGTYTPHPGVLATLTRNSGPPVSYTLVNRAKMVYTFDANGKLLTWTDAEGRTFTYSYNLAGLLTKVADSTGERFFTFTYNPQNRLTALSDHAGRTVYFSYDAVGNLASATDVLGQTWSYSYDSAHQLTQVLDPRGVISLRTEYDAEGRAIRQYDGLNNKIIEISYNEDGTSSIADARGNTTVHKYDVRKTLISETNALNDSIIKSYDKNFRPGAITDPAGDRTTLGWSSSGENLVLIVDPEGNRTDLGYDGLNNLTSVIDPRGFLTTFTYNGRLLASSTDALNNTTSYIYTPQGFLQSLTDALGRTTTFTYDEFGQPTSITDAAGNTVSYTYDNVGRLVTITDAFGRITRHEYDPAGRLIGVTVNYDPARPQNDQSQYNIVTRYAYDAVDNLVAITDTFGRVTQFVYDNGNRLIRAIDPDGNEMHYSYDPAGNLTAATDALGQTVVYSYDALNRLQTITDAAGGVTTITYNADSTVASVTNARGQTTSFAYDGLKRITTVTDPLDNTTRATYDQAGNVVASIDALGNTTTYEYDALNRLIQITDPLGNTTENFYDAVGNLVQIVDSLGRATTFEYDELNRLVAVVDALGYRTTYAYDAVGNRIAITDANGNITTFTYDRLDRPLTERDPLGHTTRYGYDAIGNLVRLTDAKGATTFFNYDTLDRLIAIHYPAPDAAVTFSYDPLGNLMEMTDGIGTTTWVRDALYRPTAVTDPFGNAVSYTYDVLSNRTGITYPTGESVAYAYDPANRLSQVTDWVANVTRYEYDAANRLTGVSLPNGVTSALTYDKANRLRQITHATGAELLSSFQYDYDPVGNRVQAIETMQVMPTFVDVPLDHEAYAEIEALYQAGYVVGCSAEPRMFCPDQNLTRAEAAVFIERGIRGGGYIPEEPTEQIFADVPLDAWYAKWANALYQDGYTAGCGTNPLIFCPEQEHTRAEAAVFFLRMLHGADYTPPAPVGLFVDVPVSSWQAKWVEAAVHAGLIEPCDAAAARFCPNEPINRTTAAIMMARAQGLPLPPAPPPPTVTTIGYSYDPVYRLVAAEYSTGDYFYYTYDAVGNRLTQETKGGAVTAYTYDVANRLTSLADATGATYLYNWDANGNLLGDGVNTYSYDHANRLRRVVQGADVYTFAYNGLGDRLQETANGVPINYTVDLNAGLTQVLADGTNLYLYGLGRIGEENPGGWAYHLADALGSTRQLAALDASLILTQAYDPFGNILTSAGPGATRFQFTGEQQHPATGLIYLRARYYDPGIGRFITKDPFPGLVTLPGTLHPYLYVVNNPTNLVDPTGEIAPILVAAGAGALIGGISGGISYALANPGGNLGDYLSSACFWQAVGIGAASGAVAGVVGWAVPALLPAAGNFAGALAIGAISNALAGGAGQITTNYLTGQSWHTGLGQAMLTEAVTGGILHGASYGLGKLGSPRLGSQAQRGASADNRLVPGAYCSFSEDTLVTTEDGLVPISEVDVGTLVLAYNEKNGDVGYYAVVAVWAHDDPIIVLLTIDGETMETTPEHPFYTEQGEWLTAALLQVGDEIRRADWDTGTVEAITFIAGPQVMYNFTVAAAHTYFVGEGQWLVHNSCPVPSYIRAVPTDQVGTSQPFKLRRGEDGLSVFEGVSPSTVLAELPGQRIPNTTVSIPGNALPPGTQVRHTPAPGLSPQLSDAHRVLIRPSGWSADRFARELKQIVGWD